jgi:hypothetical protein
MKPEQIYQELKDLAEKLGCKGLRAKLSRQRYTREKRLLPDQGKMHCIIDKNITCIKRQRSWRNRFLNCPMKICSWCLQFGI